MDYHEGRGKTCVFCVKNKWILFFISLQFTNCLCALMFMCTDVGGVLTPLVKLQFNLSGTVLGLQLPCWCVLTKQVLEISLRFTFHTLKRLIAVSYSPCVRTLVADEGTANWSNACSATGKSYDSRGKIILAYPFVIRQTFMIIAIARKFCDLIFHQHGYRSKFVLFIMLYTRYKMACIAFSWKTF